MSGRTSFITFSNVAVTAGQDFISLQAADVKPFELVSIELGQSSDAGDAQDEMLPIAVKRGYTTVGSGGSSVTPAKALPGDAAFGGTARVNDTTVASGGTPDTVLSSAFNVRAGYQKVWALDERPQVPQGGVCVINLPSAPADSLTMWGTVAIRELG